MADPFIGEIRMFAGNFAPRFFAACDGQLLSISQNDALFALLGTTYGGDGRTTFGLPDLRGRVPIHKGQGPGLSNRPIGQKSGNERETVTSAQIASHSHALMASAAAASTTSPSENLTATSTSSSIYGGAAPSVAMRGDAVANTGGSQPHENVMPYQCITFIIALFGIFPSRS